MRSIKNRLLLKGRKNKKTIITILFTLVAMAGQAQIHYRLEGTIGDSTLNTRLLLNQGMSESVSHPRLQGCRWQR